MDAPPTTAPRSTVLPTTGLLTTALLTRPARAPAGAEQRRGEQSDPLLRPTTPTTTPRVRWLATLAVIGGVAAAARALITALRSYRARGGGAAWHW